MSVYDVSHYQSAATVAHALASGAECIIVKASEGTTYVDPAHDADVRLIRGARRRAGHYHFARSVALPAREAAAFLAAANVQPGDIVALDLEAMDGSWPARVAYALAFMGVVDGATGGRCFWYVNKSWYAGLIGAASAAQLAELRRHPLWIATAGVPAGEPFGAGHGGWALHQYSTAGGIDHDVLAPGVQLSTYAVPGSSSPAPAPSPAPRPLPAPAPTPAQLRAHRRHVVHVQVLHRLHLLHLAVLHRQHLLHLAVIGRRGK